MPDHKTRKKTSKRKRESNRRNAQKSTGPRTAEGKEVVSANALRHGITATKFDSVSEALGESEEEFSLMQHQIERELRPKGVIETFFTENTLKAIWKRRRLEKFEKMALKNRLDALKLEVVKRHYAERTGSNPPELQYCSYLDTITRTDLSDQFKLITRLKSCEILDENPELLQHYGGLMALRGIANDAYYRAVEKFFRKELITLQQPERPPIESTTDSAEEREKIRRFILKIEEKRFYEMQEVFKFRDEFARIEYEAILPSTEDLAKVMRYGRHLERSVVENLRALISWKRKNDDESV